MYLKQIVINGFKSFADRTRLELQPGMTAVVGPNGCGKSNIVDALRWVLGEQSAKALRGGSMQDVIFEGTEQRKALSMCEVVLTFCDCEEELGTSFNEVEIARRVSRDGGSQYSINGKLSRLKDIQRLFANTGVGRVSYSFMLQGQIDQILSTNPAERRVIFEEAAGITLYKSQRKEALSKLALVETNLTRITDVIEEISRQIGSLKRQASKALRYERIKHRLTHLEWAHGGFRYGTLSQTIGVLANRSVEVRRDLDRLRLQLTDGEHKVASQRDQRSEISANLESAQQHRFSLISERDQARGRLEMAAVRTQDLEQRIQQFTEEIKELDNDRRALSERARNEAESKQLQLGIVDDSDRVFRQRSDELVRCQEVLSTLEGQSQNLRQTQLEAENRITRARSRATTLEVDLRTGQSRESSLKQMLVEAESVAPQLEAHVSKLTATIKSSQKEQQKLAEQLHKARQTAVAQNEAFRALQKQIQEADRAFARKTAQLGVLESLQAKFEGFGEGAKAILNGKLGDAVNADAVAVLSRSLKVPTAFAPALSTLLGMATEALYIGHSEKALTIIGQLDERQLGRACLQVDLGRSQSQHGVDPVTPSTPPALPSGIVLALSVVSVRAGGLKAPLQRLLEGCYFADSLTGFIEFWRSQPEFDFQLVATRDNALIDCRGLIYGGRESGKKPASVIERESDIAQLKTEITADREALAAEHTKASDLDSLREESERSVENLRKELSELERDGSALAAELRGENSKLEASRKQLANLRSQLQECEQNRNETVAALDKAKAELQAAETALVNERSRGDDLGQAINKARLARDGAREAVAEVRLELAEKKQRLESLDRAIGEVERASSDLIRRADKRRQEMDEMHAQIRAFAEMREQETAHIQKLEENIEYADKNLTRQKTLVDSIDATISEQEAQLAQFRQSERECDGRFTEIEVKLAETRSQAGFIEESLQTAYALDVKAIDWKEALWKADANFSKRVDLDALEDPDDITRIPEDKRGAADADTLAAMDETDWQAVDEEIRELKNRILSMGPVNVDAIAEYSDLKQRYDFLRAQSDDLWNSKNTLVEAIDEINATSQSLFKDTFEQIRRNFQFTYEKLSGGGTANLELIDSEDPLESGIEIIARPPGTRLHNITLLSGGQRTMAAVALLFSIYLVKPSPFCVLDEIDAALDDANIGRFCEILRSFTHRSQFLIITHNKRTISNADCLFGITMPEKGVSTLLSMRFNRNTNQAEVAKS
jgi:chromosome segregation protein